MKLHTILELLDPEAFAARIPDELQFADEILDYIEQHTKEIGLQEKIAEGSSRVVYKVDDDVVMKIAKNSAGLLQNKNEIITYKRLANTEMLAPILGSYSIQGLSILLMAYAKPISQQQFEKLLGLSWHNFQVLLSFGKDGGNLMMRRILSLHKAGIEDLQHLDSWGMYNNRLVILDYGLDSETAIKHY
jgi:hypothetical protein